MGGDTGSVVRRPARKGVRPVAMMHQQPMMTARAGCALLTAAAFTLVAGVLAATDVVRQLRETLRPGLKPSTAFSPEHVLFALRGRSAELEKCKASCLDAELCEGLFWWETAHGQQRCRGLSSMGRANGADTKLYGYAFCGGYLWTTHVLCTQCTIASPLHKKLTNSPASTVASRPMVLVGTG